MKWSGCGRKRRQHFREGKSVPSPRLCGAMPEGILMCPQGVWTATAGRVGTWDGAGHHLKLPLRKELEGCGVGCWGERPSGGTTWECGVG